MASNGENLDALLVIAPWRELGPKRKKRLWVFRVPRLTQYMEAPGLSFQLRVTVPVPAAAIRPVGAGGGCFGGRVGAWSGNHRYLSYPSNRHLWGRGMALIPRPTETSAWFDGALTCVGNSPGLGPTLIARPGRAPRHQEGINVTYADGHAKYLKARFDPLFPLLGTRGWWLVAGGPYSGLINLFGIVMDDGSLGMP